MRCICRNLFAIAVPGSANRTGDLPARWGKACYFQYEFPCPWEQTMEFMYPWEQWSLRVHGNKQWSSCIHENNGVYVSMGTNNGVLFSMGTMEFTYPWEHAMKPTVFLSKEQ